MFVDPLRHQGVQTVRTSLKAVLYPATMSNVIDSNLIVAC